MKAFTPTRTTLCGSGLSEGSCLSEIVVLKRFLYQHQIVIVQLSNLDYQVILLVVFFTLALLMLLLECLKLVAALK
jgi:hypothetical protein